jgi:hypothetical protein
MSTRILLSKNTFVKSAKTCNTPVIRVQKPNIRAEISPRLFAITRNIVDTRGGAGVKGDFILQ